MAVLNVTPRASLAEAALLPELLVEILVHLSLKDVLACQLVSRSWYTAFTGSSVVSVLCRRHFPGLPRPYHLADFQAECRRFLRRRRGDFTARLSHNLSCDDGSFTLDKEAGDVLAPPGVFRGPVGMVGYGEGNVVWTSGNGRLCVDNLYTRKRKVLDARGWPAFVETTAAKVTGSLLVHKHLPNSVYIHHIATDHGAAIALPSKPIEIFARKNKALVMTQTAWVYAIECSGLAKTVVHCFRVTNGLEHRDFITGNPRLGLMLQAGAFIDPYDPKRYFIAMHGKERLGISRPSNRGGELPRSVSTHLIVREFHGSNPVGTYEFEVWKVRLAGIIRAFGMDSDELWYNLMFWRHTEAPKLLPLGCVDIDGHGTFYLAGMDIVCYDVALAGLPGPVNLWSEYRILITFNTVTRRFGQQSYLCESGSFPPSHESLWNQQYFMPCLEPGNFMSVTVLDEDNSKSWQSTRRERRYSLPSGEQEAVSEPVLVPELPANIAQSPSVGQDTLGEGSETPDTTSEGWETVSEDSGRRSETRDMDGMMMWHDSDFFVFHDEVTENYVVWDFREKAR